MLFDLAKKAMSACCSVFDHGLHQMNSAYASPMSAVINTSCRF